MIPSQPQQGIGYIVMETIPYEGLYAGYPETEREHVVYPTIEAAREAAENLPDRWDGAEIVKVHVPAMTGTQPSCHRCDLDTHRCAGCGVPVNHGTVACRDCGHPAHGIDPCPEVAVPLSRLGERPNA